MQITTLNDMRLMQQSPQNMVFTSIFGWFLRFGSLRKHREDKY
ncbi:Uncharacterised protein [Yersinia mollaretii]|nr:Uncharacterised protein [Yersinia mollaretii]CQJ07836.1 Uncharacterised protein [Yersinia mollaretii]